MIATEPIEEMLFEIPHYGRHGFDYWHQRLDGRIVAGGFRDVSLDTEFTAEEVTTPVVQEALERFVEEHVGRPLRVDYRWAGIFGMVFDFLPVVGRVPGADGLWMAGGYSGHGNVLGFACGRLVARAILGERDPKLELFEPSRLLVRLELELLQLELAGLGVRRLRDREILDREAGRVEERDVAGAPAAVRLAGEHRAELGDPSRDTTPAATPAASSPPWLACSQSSQKRCARESSATATSAFPGPSAPMSETCWPASSESSG